MTMPIGRVKFFNGNFGFIQAGDGTEVHVHSSQLEKAGIATLTPGQVVRYEPFTNVSGRTAAENLQLIGNAKSAPAHGVVRSFSSEGGYGFITASNGTNVFVHISQVEQAGLSTLERGQRVAFTIFDNPRGPVAENIKIK
jgi:cold shock protein